MTTSYKNISKNRKVQADRILASSQLLEKLREIGKVSIIDGYKYDLLYDPDIDVIVETDTPRMGALQALNMFFDSKYLRKLGIGDFENFPIPNRPRSYILVLKTTQNEVKWEIEIWFHKSFPSKMKEFEDMMSGMTDRQREQILKMKYQRSKEGNTKFDLSNIEIYKRVLLKGK